MSNMQNHTLTPLDQPILTTKRQKAHCACCPWCRKVCSMGTLTQHVLRCKVRTSPDLRPLYDSFGAQIVEPEPIQEVQVESESQALDPKTTFTEERDTLPLESHTPHIHITRETESTGDPLEEEDTSRTSQPNTQVGQANQRTFRPEVCLKPYTYNIQPLEDRLLFSLRDLFSLQWHRTIDRRRKLEQKRVRYTLRGLLLKTSLPGCLRCELLKRKQSTSKVYTHRYKHVLHQLLDHHGPTLGYDLDKVMWIAGLLMNTSKSLDSVETQVLSRSLQEIRGNAWIY